ncbi:MAG: hypothetical protein ACM3N0_01940 [Chloroflexota bacterium]
MSNLPVRFSDVARPSRALIRAARATQRTELDIYEHGLATRRQVECDRIDSAAIADVTRTALDAEMTNLDYGLERAGQSPAKRELVARMVAQQSRIDIARIERRFGA